VVGARLQSPGYRASRSLRKALFPKTDPTLREATPKTIKSLTLADVKAYYKHVYRPDMTTITVIGKVTPEQARATIEKYFGDWTATGPKPDTDLPAAPRNKASTVAVPDARRVQDVVTLAETLPLTRSNKDFYAVDLGDAVLGGGFYSTRLSIDLRKNSGLVYSVGSGLQSGKTRSVYFVSYACDPENVSKAARLVADEIKKMQDSPASADEIARAKALLLRRIPLNNASVSAIASGFFARRDLDLPLDEPTIAAQHFIALDAKEVQAAFKKWIRADGMVRVSQGPTPH
jgi:zinc protease